MDNEQKISIVTTHKILDNDTSGLSAECLRRIEDYTITPHELIAIDNDSNFAYVGDLFNNYTNTWIRNTYNAGNPMAWDQGVALSNNDIIILMDNDCWPLIDGWEKEMVSRLSDPMVGITFPSSIVGDQLDRMNSGLQVEFYPRRDGFCFAFRKEVYNKVGRFLCDQPFKLGYYEDDWFEYRVQYELGLKLVGCQSSRVWHKGQGTTKKMWNKEIEEGIEANRLWYESKTKAKYPYLIE